MMQVGTNNTSLVLSKNEWVKFFEANSIMLIFINPKSEYRNPKQYLNTKFKIENISP